MSLAAPEGRKRFGFVWTSPILTGGAPPVEIPPIDLRQAQRLTLRTLFAPASDIGDHINWCDALLIR